MPRAAASMRIDVPGRHLCAEESLNPLGKRRHLVRCRGAAWGETTHRCILHGAMVQRLQNKSVPLVPEQHTTFL